MGRQWSNQLLKASWVGGGKRLGGWLVDWTRNDGWKVSCFRNVLEMLQATNADRICGTKSRMMLTISTVNIKIRDIFEQSIAIITEINGNNEKQYNIIITRDWKRIIRFHKAPFDFYWKSPQTLLSGWKLRFFFYTDRMPNAISKYNVFFRQEPYFFVQKKMVEQVAVEFPLQFHLNLSNPGRSRGESPDPPLIPGFPPLTWTIFGSLLRHVNSNVFGPIWSNTRQKRPASLAFMDPRKKARPALFQWVLLRQ